MILALQIWGTLVVVGGALLVGAVVFLPFLGLWAWGRWHNERTP